MLDFNTTEYDNLKISQLKRMADYWQRQYLLKNAERKYYGKIYCPLKKRLYHESRMHVAHFYDRSRMCTRYHPDNVHLISEQSNVWDARVQVEGYKSRHHKEYEEYLKEKIGEEKFENLLELSKQNCIFVKEDYIELIEKYRVDE